jgi:histidine triad (HIT) family protein
VSSCIACIGASHWQLRLAAVYDDDKAYAFRDISPTAPTHVLIVPKVYDGLSGLQAVRFCGQKMC